MNSQQRFNFSSNERKHKKADIVDNPYEEQPEVEEVYEHKEEEP